MAGRPARRNPSEHHHDAHRKRHRERRQVPQRSERRTEPRDDARAEDDQQGADEPVAELAAPAHAPGGPQGAPEQHQVRGDRDQLRQPVRRRTVAEHELARRQVRSERRRIERRAPQDRDGVGGHEHEHDPHAGLKRAVADQQHQLASGQERHVQHRPQGPVELELSGGPAPRGSEHDRGRSHRVHHERERPGELVRAAAGEVLPRDEAGEDRGDHGGDQREHPHVPSIRGHLQATPGPPLPTMRS